MNDLERQFDAEMMTIYQTARDEANYNAMRYLQMLHDHGGLETAHILLNANGVSEGYTALWERNRLDLTVEVMVLRHPEYAALFEPEELKTARSRLQDYQYAGV